PISKVTANYCQYVGMSDFIAKTHDQYIKMAIDLYEYGDELAQVKQNLLEKRSESPLFDGERLITNLEKIYENMWQDKVGN
ncbi:MAG: hypothetical protein KC414_13530, partial [Romboutsia sp.]|nr:hypothetical protein [Romboutsia sp.]